MFRREKSSAANGASAGAGVAVAGAAAGQDGARRARPREYVDRRGYSGNATLRQVNRVLVVVILLLLGANVWLVGKFYQYAVSTWEQQAVVFRVNGKETTVHEMSEFTSGPYEEEIIGKAWDATRWYLEAGTADYETKFAELRRLLSPEFQEKFDRNKPALVEELTAQKIYRKIEGAKPRPLEEGDLPAGAPIKITRYDYVIEGRLDTYRIDGSDTEPVTTRPFALWVRQKPLDVRTRENPQALEVADMNFIDVRPRSSASPTPTPGDTKRGGAEGKEAGEEK